MTELCENKLLFYQVYVLAFWDAVKAALRQKDDLFEAENWSS